MATTYKNIYDAVMARILAGWSATEIHWPVTRYTPKPATAFIQPRLIFASAEQVTMGASSLNRIDGDLHINVFAPAGAGEDEALTYCDSLRALFPRGLLLTAGTRTMRFDVPEVRQPVEDEDWHQVPVFCPFYMDEVQT